MDYKDVLEKIDRWQSVMIAADSNIDALMSIMMASPRSDFMAPMRAVLESYTEEVSESISDKDNFLKWWWIDCSFGKVGHAEISLFGCDPITIKNTIDLCGFIHSRNGI